MLNLVGWDALCTLFGQDDLYHRGGNETLGFRRDGVPGVGTGAGHRKSRFDLYESRFVTVADPTLAGVIACKSYRRAERFQEIGAKGDYEIGTTKVIVG